MKKTQEGFLHIPEVPDYCIVNAYRKSEAMGTLRGSVLGGKGNFHGCLGEEIVKLVLNHFEFEYTDTDLDDPDALTFNFDLAVNFDGSFRTLEVKTKQRAQPPRLHYDGIVQNINQTTDFYAFVQLNKKTYREAWLLGIIDKPTFMAKKQFVSAGSPLPNGTRFVSDCHRITYDDLTRF